MKITIQNLKTLPEIDGKANVVTQVGYVVTSDDDETSYSACEVLQRDDLTDFTAFEDLTEAKVVGWLEEKITTQRMETKLAEVKAANENKEPGIPWAAAAPAAEESSEEESDASE